MREAAPFSFIQQTANEPTDDRCARFRRRSSREISGRSSARTWQVHGSARSGLACRQWRATCFSTAIRSRSGRGSPCRRRSVHASGQETQAVYGFASMLAKLLEDQSPTGMAVAFDRREPTFETGSRRPTRRAGPRPPEPLLEQIELIRRLVETLGVPAVDAEGYEADDVIATLATRLASEGQRSGDS